MLLSRETFHRLNRIVVLAAMVLSFVLPLCVITVYRELPAMPELPVTEDAGYAPSAEPESQPFRGIRRRRPLSLQEPPLRCYGRSGRYAVYCTRSAGAQGAAGRWLRARTHRPAGHSVQLVPLYRDVGKDLAENGEAIVLHEKAHLRLRHSFDLLVTDLAGCLQWFNPAMWLLRRELRAIHEYEADEAVLDSGVDARQYQLLLIRGKAAGGRWYQSPTALITVNLKTVLP